MKKLFAVFGAILALLVVALFAAPMLLPQDYIEARLAQALQRSSGLRLENAGSLRFVLLPQPGVVIDGASARLPEHFTQTATIRADRIFAALRLSSMLSRKWQASHIVITHPSIQFDADASSPSDGQRARPLPAAHAGNATADRALISPPRLKQFKLPTADIDFVDGELGFTHEAQQRRIELKNFNLTMRRTGDKSAAAVGRMRLVDEDVRLEIAATEPETPGEAGTVSLKLTSAPMRWSLNGTLALQDAPRFSGRAHIDVPSGERLAALLGGTSQVIARLSNSAFDGQFEITRNSFTLSDATLRGPGTEGALEAAVDFGGIASVTLKRLNLHGGMGHGRFTLDGRQPSAAVLGGSFEVSGVDMLALSTAYSNFDWLSGRADVNLQIAGGGNNLAAITETLTGEGRVNVTKGALEGLDLPLIVAKVGDGEFKKWRREPGMRTEFDTFAASFKLDKGVASTEDMALNGPNVAVSGAGTADLTRQQLKFKIKTRITARDMAPAGATDGGAQQQAHAGADTLAIPLVIKGDLKHPTIRPDISGVLKDGKGLTSNAKFLGKSVEKALRNEDIGNALEGLFRKKKKKRPDEADMAAPPPASSAEEDDADADGEDAR